MNNKVNTSPLNLRPDSVSSGVQQINLFISQSIASFIPGAVSILSYAERLYQLPLAIIGVTFGTILLPELSQIYKKKDITSANNLQNNAIILSLVLSVPATIGLFVLANPIIHCTCSINSYNAGSNALPYGSNCSRLL